MLYVIKLGYRWIKSATERILRFIYTIGKLNLFDCTKHNQSEVVLEFISKFIKVTRAEQEVLRYIFVQERSYWFARMLRLAFNRGTTVLSDSQQIYAWRDVDGQVYNITGAIDGKDYRHSWKKFREVQTPLEFVAEFVSNNTEVAEILANTFSNGYCWYFAHILQERLKRGVVCIAAPLGHIVWVDNDGTPYDVYGVHEGECIYYIPEVFLGDTVEDFMHVPGRTKFASQEDVVRIMETYEKHMGKSGGVIMWKETMGE